MFLIIGSPGAMKFGIYSLLAAVFVIISLYSYSNAKQLLSINRSSTDAPNLYAV